jgi:DNA-directed RNA polymerase subunit RPC12/RpoP
MADSKVDIVCANCGKTFSAFMRQMAKHNAKVACPKCGKVLDPAQLREATKGSHQKSPAADG